MRLLRRFGRSSSDAGIVEDALGFDWDDEGSELEMQLRRFAADDLSADEAALSRMKLRAVAAFVESAAPPRRAVWNRRRALATIGAVAVLTLSTVGLATAESGPGQPFYRLRLGIESVNLPAAGSQSRLNADLDRGDARLDDVAREAANSMWSGAADAAGAYVDAVSGITLPLDATGGAAAARLQTQLARLVQLRATAHDPETAQLDRAIELVAGILGVPVPAPAQSATPAAEPNSTSREPTTESEAPETNATNPHRSSEPQESDRPHPDASGTPPAGPGDGGYGGSGGHGDNGDHGDHGNATASPAPSQSPDPSASPTPSGRSWSTPRPTGWQSN